MMYDDTTRRRFLGALASGAAVALAGCNGGKEMRDEPNPYDYTFVEGDDLARELPAYEGKDIKTQTTVRFEDFLQSIDYDDLRLYTATPADTENTFPVAEELYGPIYDLFGEQLDDSSHEDVELELYGFVEYVSNDGYDVSSSYNRYTFIVEDATRVEDTGDGQ